MLHAPNARRAPFYALFALAAATALHAANAPAQVGQASRLPPATTPQTDDDANNPEIADADIRKDGFIIAQEVVKLVNHLRAKNRPYPSSLHDPIRIKAYETVDRYTQSPRQSAQKTIEEWFKIVKAAPDQTPLEKSMIAFQEGNLPVAETQAKLALKQQLTHPEAPPIALRQDLIPYYLQYGLALAARENYAEADPIYKQALAQIPDNFPAKRKQELQLMVALNAFALAGKTQGNVARQHRQTAITLFREVLKNTSRKDTPSQWATVTNNLASALRAQGDASTGEEKNRLYLESARTYQEALKEFGDELPPFHWVAIQENIAICLYTVAQARTGIERIQLLEESCVAVREGLKIRTQKDFPEKWATMQRSITEALVEQLRTASKLHQHRRYAPILKEIREIAKIFPREISPIDWARIQSNLATALHFNAFQHQYNETSQLLAEAIVCLRNALQVFTRDTTRQYWAETQVALGEILIRRAQVGYPINRTALLTEGIAAYQEALTAYTRENTPRRWTKIKTDLSEAILLHASFSPLPQPERIRQLKKALACAEETLQVRPQEKYPEDFKKLKNIIAAILDILAATETPPPPTK